MFIALTEGDNRNIMAAQLANEALGIERVVAKVNDPVRANAYAELGIATLCRTGLMMDSINSYLGLPPSGLPGLLASTGHHHDSHDRHGPTARRTPPRTAPRPTTPATPMTMTPPPDPAATVSQEA